MPAIGYVNRHEDGFKGQLKTVSIRSDIAIIRNRTKAHPNQPDYRVIYSGCEVGGGWIKTGERSGKDYVSLSLVAPEFGPRVLYANLGRAAGQDDDEAFAIIWNPAD